MRRLCLALLLLSAPAWAYEAGSTYGAYAAPDSETNTAPSAGFVPGGWTVDLRGGAAVALGNQSQDNSPGGAGGADAGYQWSPNWDLDLLGLYAEMPYTSAGGGARNPLSVSGLALKADYQLYSADQTSAWIGVGVGLMAKEISQYYVTDPGRSPITYATQPQGSLGLAFVGCLGADYAFLPQWTAGLELLVLSMDSMGGTSNNLLAAVPGVFVRWTYMDWIPGHPQGEPR